MCWCLVELIEVKIETWSHGCNIAQWIRLGLLRFLIRLPMSLVL